MLYIIIGVKLTLLTKISSIGLTCLYAIRYVYVNLLYISLIATR
jgi:hypothetical protein